MTVPSPPSVFDALVHVIPAGELLHRVHDPRRRADAFNPGRGARTRFAPLVTRAGAIPTLYAAQTAEATVSETLLHDVPLSGGQLPLGSYAGYVEATLEARRDLRLAKLMGDGLRRLGVAPEQLTATTGDVYEHTVAWAAAAHAAGFEGLAWMSARDNTSAAYVLFGDRVASSDLSIVDHGLGAFVPGSGGFDWLSAYCARVKVELLLA